MRIPSGWISVLRPEIFFYFCLSLMLRRKAWMICSNLVPVFALPLIRSNSFQYLPSFKCLSEFAPPSVETEDESNIRALNCNILGYFETTAISLVGLKLE